MGILGDIAHGIEHEGSREEAFHHGREKGRDEARGEIEELRGKVEHLRLRKEELESAVSHARDEGRQSAKEEARAELNDFGRELKEKVHNIWVLLKDKFGE